MADRLKRASLSLRWFGTFRRQVHGEADLFIGRYGALADRYSRDHVRLATKRRRRRDVVLYTAVTEEIAARRMRAGQPVAVAAGAVWLPDWVPAINGALAILA
jgi:hypothetical protein